jgi:hypothetical protein
MTIRELLLEEIKTLPDDLAEQVFDFVAFVRARAERRREAFAHEQAERQTDGQVTNTWSRVSEEEYKVLREALKDDPIVGMFSGSLNLAADPATHEAFTLLP